MSYCGESCLRRHIELKKETKNRLTKAYDNNGKNNDNYSDSSIESVLTDPIYQRGAGYRAEKLKAIAKARKQGLTESQIRKLLLRGGLTKQTASVMMQDSREAYS